MAAGKHVYLEKPCSHNPREGELLIEAEISPGGRGRWHALNTSSASILLVSGLPMHARKPKPLPESSKVQDLLGIVRPAGIEAHRGLAPFALVTDSLLPNDLTPGPVGGSVEIDPVAIPSDPREIMQRMTAGPPRNFFCVHVDIATQRWRIGDYDMPGRYNRHHPGQKRSANTHQASSSLPAPK